MLFFFRKGEKGMSSPIVKENASLYEKLMGEVRLFTASEGWLHRWKIAS